MAEVTLRGVSKSFGVGDSAVQAVDDMHLHIADGSFVVLLGPTGAGKTTTLRLISGLEPCDSGELLIGGENAINSTPAQRNVAMVFQQYSLYPHLSVRDNLAFPLKSPLLKTPKKQIETRVKEVAAVLQISDKLDNKATELSGGEMQRVSIGRALVREPSIFLMDEPLSSLDAKLRSELRLELKRLQADLGATFLYVTHDQIEAMTMATHIGVLNEGKLVQFGTPREIYESPNSLYVASRLGLPRINTLPANVFGNAPNGASTVGLRPEHIIISDTKEPNSLQASVQRIEALGDQTRLHLTVQNHPIVTLMNVDKPVNIGHNINIALHNPLYFDINGMRV